MKNKLSDLNNHLFAQMERLDDEELKGDDLRQEIERAKAVTGVASQIIANGQLVLKATVAKSQYMDKGDKMPELLCGGDK